MKLTLSWLKDHLVTDADVTTIADKLTSIGLEVESLEDKAASLARVQRRARGHGRAASQRRQAAAAQRRYRA